MRHIRMNTPPARWMDAHAGHVSRIIKIQAIFRGWRLRKRLEWAGAGVLRRSECVNEEDVATLDEIQTLHPDD